MSTKITKEILELMAADANTTIEQSAWDAVPCPSIDSAVNGWILVRDLGIQNPAIGQEFLALTECKLGVKSMVYARRCRIDQIRNQDVITVRGPEDLSVLTVPTKSKTAVKITQLNS